MPPDLRRRLAALEQQLPRDPTPFVVEMPIAVLRADAEVQNAWAEQCGVEGPAAFVPPKMTVEEWTATFSRPPGGS